MEFDLCGTWRLGNLSDRVDVRGEGGVNTAKEQKKSKKKQEQVPKFKFSKFHCS